MATGEQTVDDFLQQYQTLQLDNGERVVPLQRLMPPALSALWYATPAMWMHPSQSPETQVSNIDKGLGDILRHLHAHAVDLNANLGTSLEDPSSNSLASFAVKESTKDRRAGHPSVTEWHHGLLLTALYDRLLWARSEDVSRDAGLVQVPLMNSIQMSDQAKPYRELYLGWPETVQNLAEEWRKRGADIPEENLDVSSEVQAVGASLFRGHTAAEAKRLVNTVECNFAWAALALCALRQPFLRDESGKKRRLVEGISSAMSPEEASALEGMSDFDFLRALYTCVAFSPLALLGRYCVSKNATTSRRLALHIMVEALSHPALEKDTIRLTIEHDCWCLLVGMAVHRHSYFKRGMAFLLEKWEPLLAGKSSEDLCVQYSPDDWKEKVVEHADLAEEGKRLDVVLSKLIAAVAAKPKLSKLGTLPYTDPKWVEVFAEIAHEHVTAVPIAKSKEKEKEKDAGEKNSNGDADDGRRKSGRAKKEPPARGPQLVSGDGSENGKSSAESASSKKRSNGGGRGGAKTKKRRVSGSMISTASSEENGSEGEGEEEDIKPVIKLPDPAEILAPKIDETVVEPYYIRSPEEMDGMLTWTTRKVEVRRWKTMSKDFAMLDAILKSGALISGESDTKESPGGEVLSFSRTEWAGISESKRRDIFSKHHIRVTGNGPSFDVMSDVKSWDDSDALAKYTSLLELRQAHDSFIYAPETNLRKRMVKTTVANLRAQALRGDDAQPLNILELGLFGMAYPTRDFDDSARDYQTDHPKILFDTTMPSGPLAWGLAATAPSFSRSHVDASGFATYVRVVLGEKIWIVAVNDALPKKDGWEDSRFRWQAIVLKAGDDFYMRPGTVHCVLTSKHSFVAGGHFYSHVCYWSSLRSITLEHYFGRYITNTEHPESAIALFRTVCGILNAWPKDQFYGRKPKWDELASLIILVGHFDQLEPLLPDDAARAVWHGTESFAHDFKAAFHGLRLLLNEAFCPDLHDAFEDVLERFTDLVRDCERVSTDKLRKIKIIPLRTWEEFMGMHDDGSSDFLDQYNMDLSS